MVNGNERTMRSAITLGLGIWIAAAAPALRAQVSPSTPNSVKSALQGGGAPAQQPAKPGAKTAGKTTRKSPAKQAVKAVEKPATPGAPPEAAESEVKQARRDPF